MSGSPRFPAAPPPQRGCRAGGPGSSGSRSSLFLADSLRPEFPKGITAKAGLHILVAVLAALLIPSLAAAQNTTNPAAKPTPPVPRTADGKPDLSGVWQPGSDRPGTWAEANEGHGVPDPSGRPPVRRGANPPYQAWAAKLVLEAFNRRNIDDLVARCIPELDLGAGALYPNQFVQTPNLIVILIESRHAFRIIPLNQPHPDDVDPSFMGDAVGHWEGDTLVVDVIGFKERLVGSKISTDALHIVERFTRVDYNTIEYEARVEDPKALMRPYTITSKYMLRPGTRIQEWVCENNQDPQRFEELDKKGLVKRK